jgi:hypothetical protein
MIRVYHRSAALRRSRVRCRLGLIDKEPWFFLVGQRNLAFFAAVLSSTNLSIPWLGYEAYSFLAAVTCATLQALTHLTTMA